MKKYIFLTFAVSGIGGTQIYIRNKIKYLKSKQWDVSVICTEPGHSICVEELKEYENCVIPELMSNPYIFTNAERKQIINKAKIMIGEISQDTIIESNFIQVNLWGELIAKELGVKHFVFLIQEDYSIKDKRYIDFYDYKYTRMELAANTPYALRMLFKGYRNIQDGKECFLRAICHNTIEECDTNHIDSIVEADIHIGSIGRVNKPFVIPMINDVCQFADLHTDKKIQLVLFGGSPDFNDYTRIQDIAKSHSNLCVYITGPIFPIPKSLLDMMDVFISSAGSATTTSDVGYFTITIDANDYKPIGLLGYTTNDTVHRAPTAEYEETTVLLEDIIIDKKYGDASILYENCEDEIEKEFDRHMEFISFETKGEYYNIKKMQPKLVTRLVAALFGRKRLGTIFSIINIFRGK